MSAVRSDTMKQSVITDRQVELMVIALTDLEQRGNAAASGIMISLRRDGANKRKLLMGYYAILFECLSVMQMSIETTRDPKEVSGA